MCYSSFKLLYKKIQHKQKQVGLARWGIFKGHCESMTHWATVKLRTDGQTHIRTERPHGQADGGAGKVQGDPSTCPTSQLSLSLILYTAYTLAPASYKHIHCTWGTLHGCSIRKKCNDKVKEKSKPGWCFSQHNCFPKFPSLYLNLTKRFASLLWSLLS